MFSPFQKQQSREVTVKVQSRFSEESVPTFTEQKQFRNSRISFLIPHKTRGGIMS